MAVLLLVLLYVVSLYHILCFTSFEENVPIVKITSRDTALGPDVYFLFYFLELLICNESCIC